MFHDDENLDPPRPLDCREPDLAASKIDMIESIEWATWEACALSLGETDEVKIRRLYEQWREPNVPDGAA